MKVIFIKLYLKNLEKNPDFLLCGLFIIPLEYFLDSYLDLFQQEEAIIYIKKI